MSGRHVVAFRYPAPEGSLFAADAFADQIGQRIEVSYDLGGGLVRRVGILHAARVDEDGSGALLMMEVQDEA